MLDAKAAAVPPGCDGLVCLDYWQGNRCPLKDPRGRGVFWGLTLAHGPGHVFRSIYEATAYGTRHILEDVQAHGLEIKRLFAGGGGAKSRLWIQIHADVLGRPVLLPREPEACALGSALVAAVHAGRFADLAEAAREMVRIAEVVEPRPEDAGGLRRGVCALPGDVSGAAGVDAPRLAATRSGALRRKRSACASRLTGALRTAPPRRRGTASASRR